MTEQAKPTLKGRDFGAFRAAHDDSFIVPKKIQDALAQLGNSWVYEQEFIKLCGPGVSQMKFAVYREQFSEFFIEPTGGRDGGRNKRIWCGTKAFAAKLRGVAQQ